METSERGNFLNIRALTSRSSANLPPRPFKCSPPRLPLISRSLSKSFTAADIKALEKSTSDYRLWVVAELPARSVGVHPEDLEMSSMA